MVSSPHSVGPFVSSVDLIDEDLALEVYENAAEKERDELNDVVLEAVQLARERIAHMHRGVESVPVREAEELLHSTKSIVGCLALKRCWTCLDDLESNWRNYTPMLRQEMLVATEKALAEGISVLAERFRFLVAVRRIALARS